MQQSQLKTMLILSVSCFCMVSIVLVMVYSSTMSCTTNQLVVAAQSQARLIEAIAEQDSDHASRCPDLHPDAEQLTLDKITAAHEKHIGFGSTGEFTLAKLEGDSIVFQFSHRSDRMEKPKSIAFNSDKAEPMRLALIGKSGVVQALDYRGKEVLAAYEPVDNLGMGIVAKIDLAEVRKPFNNAIIICFTLSILIVTGGSFLILRAFRPLVDNIGKRTKQLEAEVAARNKLESELRESEARLRTIFDNIGEGIIVADPQENFIFVNPVAERIFGTAPGQLVGHNFCEYVNEEQYQGILEETTKRRRGDRTQYEVEITRADGVKRILRVTATPELDKDNNLVAEFGIFSDVTKIRESQALLRWLNKAVESSNEVVFMTDRDGVFIYANPAFTKLYGYKAHEVIGIETPRILKSGEQESDYYKRFWKTLLSGRGVEDEIVNKTSEGKLVTIAISVNAVKNEKGDVETFLAVQRDITEQKLAEFQLMEYTQEVESLVGKEQELTAELKLSLEELEKSKAETEAALRELKVAQTAMVQSEKMASIGVLAAGIAHEINNPVGYVANNLRELLNYTTKIQEYLKHVSKLESSVSESDLVTALQLQQELAESRRQKKLEFILEDLSVLITDSLQGTSNIETIVKSLKLFSRKDDDGMIPLDLQEIIDNSIRVVNNQLKYHAEVTIEAEMIPEVLGQIGGLQQVFSNLLVNAAQAIKDSGRITIRIHQSGNMVVTQIEDTGCGIPSESLDRIFEPFYTTKDVGEGTGLGLSIVFDIIKKHHGLIDVESEPGAGTTFTIHLPVANQETSKEFGDI